MGHFNVEVQGSYLFLSLFKLELSLSLNWHHCSTKFRYQSLIWICFVLCFDVSCLKIDLKNMFWTFIASKIKLFRSAAPHWTCFVLQSLTNSQTHSLTHKLTHSIRTHSQTHSITFFVCLLLFKIKELSLYKKNVIMPKLFMLTI